MAWWKLVVTDKNELTDEDRTHIATLIEGGFTEGELLDEDYEEGDE